MGLSRPDGQERELYFGRRRNSSVWRTSNPISQVLAGLDGF